jgi:ABC-type lipopolysaccharide export system ATPase subunit
MLTVSQLSKSFAGRALFDDVSLQVNRGDRIGRPQWGWDAGRAAFASLL